MNKVSQNETSNDAKSGIIDTAFQLNNHTSTVTLQLTNKVANEEKPTDWGTIVVTLIIGAAISQLITYTKDKFSDKSKRKKKMQNMVFMMLLHVKLTIEQARYLISLLSEYEADLEKRGPKIEKTKASPPLSSDLYRGLDKTDLFEAFGTTLLDLESFYEAVDIHKDRNPTSLHRSFLGSIEKYKKEYENKQLNLAIVACQKTISASEIYRHSLEILIADGKKIIEKHSPKSK